MTAVLKSKQAIGPGSTLYISECKEIASAARPGQFLEVRTAKGHHPAMRKPLSVFCVEGDTFGMLVKTVGYGAEFMINRKPGDIFDIIGPLGQGFRYSEKDDNFILAAGGIGLAPLNFLARELTKKGKKVYLLFSPKRDAALTDAITERSGLDIAYTENRHTVADDLKKMIERVKDPCGVFTCGPNSFMKLVSETASLYGLKTQASLETRMSCGMGVCLGCVVPIRAEGDFIYKTVCRDGPVFDAGEVIFE
ncbi:MAG: hypothetical protein FWG32_09495 [Oscillospiraceae bacterium]|nr:hypothetical protein [Oscillospiraceae bacterium]